MKKVINKKVHFAWILNREKNFFNALSNLLSREREIVMICCFGPEIRSVFVVVGCLRKENCSKRFKRWKKNSARKRIHKADTKSDLFFDRKWNLDFSLFLSMISITQVFFIHRYSEYIILIMYSKSTSKHTFWFSIYWFGHTLI